jgi:hypothetical protein
MNFHFCFRLFTGLGLLAVVVSSGSSAQAVTRTGSVAGVWSSAATWGGNPAPVAGDAVIINAGVTVTVDAPASCASLAFLAPNTVNGITLSGTNSLAVSGGITTVVPAASSRSTRIAVGSGSLTAGSLALAGAGTATRYTELSIADGTATIVSNLTTAGIESRIRFTGAGTLKVGGSFMSAAAGTFTPATGTVEFNGPAPLIRGTNYNNLVVNAGAGNTASLTGNPAVAGNLTIASGTLNLAAFTANRASAGGALTVAANAGLIAGGAANFPSNYATVALDPASTVAFAGAGDQTVNGLSYGHLTLSGGGAKSIFTGVTVAGDLSIAPTGAAVAVVADGLDLAVERLSLGGFGRINGSWGSSASGATYQDDTFFDPTTGRVIVNSDSRTYSTLTIAGDPAPYATPGPLGYGETGGLLSGSWLTNSVAPAVMAGGLGWRCDGWRLAKTVGGAALAQGSGTQAVFQVSTNITLTWVWTNYWLTIAGSPANFSAASPLNYGAYTNIEESAWITNSVVTPVNELNGNRKACAGWTLAVAGGGVISGGPGSQAEFQMRAENLALTWSWANEYYLDATANSNGTVTAAGWHVDGSQAQLEASADGGHVFLQWAGDVPVGAHTNNPLTVTMDRARAIRAQFAAESAASRTWRGNGNWFTATNWAPMGVPGTGDVVFIGSGSCTLADPARVGSMTISNATLVFTNWLTALTVAGGVRLQTNATLTTPVTAYRSALSNRVHLVCDSLVVEGGGRINVDAKGYGGGWAANGIANFDSYGIGPGAIAAAYPGAGSYGGRGGEQFSTTPAYRSGNLYGDYAAPTGPGSGGGSTDGRAGYAGGNGGGAVRIEAAGHVLVNGAITANGGLASQYSSPGSGGAIWISCRTIGGTNGLVSATGLSADRGGGGGGRVAITYNPVEQAALPSPELSLSTRGGLGTGVSPVRDGDIGSLYLTDWSLLGEVINDAGKLFLETGLPAGFDRLNVSNGWIRFPEGGYALTVTNDVVVQGPTGRLDFGGNQHYSSSGLWSPLNTASAATTVEVGGSVILTNAGQMGLVSAPTNAAAGPAGGWLVVNGRLEVGSQSELFLYSSQTNGGSYRILCGDLVIRTNGGVYANGAGFAGGRNSSGLGYGGGRYSGGGHGGYGGAYDIDNLGRGAAYGASNRVVHCGSGGGAGDSLARYQNSAGFGGGLIWIEAVNGMTVDGAIQASGGAGGVNYSSGGAGGGIYLACRRWAGRATGQVRANGGSSGGGTGGGGGGGRIHIRRRVIYDTYAGAYSVTGGNGVYEDGAAGTVYLEELPGAGGTLLIVR